MRDVAGNEPSKRPLYHMLCLLGIKTSPHKQAIIMEDLNRLAEAMKAGYGRAGQIALSVENFNVLKGVSYP